MLVPELIKYLNASRYKATAAYFEDRCGFPQSVVGAADDSHIPIIAPPQYHTDSFNHNGWLSIVLQGVVGGKELFSRAFVGLPGSLHDARVLQLSTLLELAIYGNRFPLHTRYIGTVTVIMTLDIQNFLCRTDS